MQDCQLLQTSQDTSWFPFLNGVYLLVQDATVVRKYKVRAVGRRFHGAYVAHRRSVVVRGEIRLPLLVVTAGYHPVRRELGMVMRPYLGLPRNLHEAFKLSEFIE